MKKYFFIFFLFSLTIIGLIIWRRQTMVRTRLGSAPTAPVQELTQLTAPTFPPPATGNQPQYRAPETLTGFPLYLPHHQMSQASFGEAATRVAIALGFSGNPKETKNVSGATYFWNASGSSLVATENTSEIIFLSGKTAAEPIANTTKPDAAARELLSRLGIPASPYQLLGLTPRYFTNPGFEPYEVDSTSGATIIEISYAYVLVDRTVYGIHPEKPSISIRFNAKGEVVSLAATLLPPATASGKSIAIATAQEAVSRLLGKEGVLVSLLSEADKNSFSGPQYTVSTATTQRLSLGFYFDRGSVSLIPVFLAEGVGNNADDGKEVRFMTLVSALPSSE